MVSCVPDWRDEMKTKRCFEVMRELECIAGDTLPQFTVSLTKNNEQITASSDQTLKVTLSAAESPAEVTLTKEAESIGGKFVVKLTSEDTVKLHGDYIMLFSLHGSDGLVYRKIVGRLHVHPAPKG